ncbi:hypothetical protein M569_07376, partial [Genlisea aurea]
MESNDVDEEEEFGFSRNYFLAKELRSSGKKSSRKLSDIDIVAEQDLRDACSKIELKSEKEMNALVDSYKNAYSEWLLILRCGFGLLLYGFGSKKALLEDFASTALTEHSVIVINGYLQCINLKQVVVAMAETLRDQLKTRRKFTPGNQTKDHHHQQAFSSLSMNDLISFLHGPQLDNEECFICVVINNIDGPCLRDSDTQQYLARLAACSHVRVVSSIDHINAPLLWDKKMAYSQFNWYWHHVPTFAPYKIEGMFHPLILAQNGGAQSVKTASIVLKSLTPNAQNVFKILASHQLANPNEEG